MALPILLITTLVGLLFLTTETRAQNFSLITEYKGASFFPNFRYNISIDNTTWGNVNYVGPSANLTYINTAGNAIIKVDNTTTAAKGNTSFFRDSFKLVSKASYDVGSLIIVDALHVPYGCSLWPAIWLLSTITTDDGGEIDIFESVNMDRAAQYTLHTRNGCTQSNSSAMPYTGQIISTNCDYNNMGNQGCQFREKRASSAGADFARAGGGVFATLFDADGVKTWFFPRSSLPADIGSANLDPSKWPTPSATWPARSCDMAKYFTPQNIVINISICGDWAGQDSVFAQTCSGKCTDYLADPKNYDTAYFELASIRAYSGGLRLPNGTSSGNSNGTAIDPSIPKNTAMASVLPFNYASMMIVLAALVMST